MDEDIEDTARRLSAKSIDELRPKSHYSPGKRELHVDFIGPFQGQIFVTVVDSNSK